MPFIENLYSSLDFGSIDTTMVKTRPARRVGSCREDGWVIIKPYEIANSVCTPPRHEAISEPKSFPRCHACPSSSNSLVSSPGEVYSSTNHSIVYESNNFVANGRQGIFVEITTPLTPETTYFDCPVCITSRPLRSQSCSELSRTSLQIDWNQHLWMSEALHSCRRKHLFQGRGQWLFESDIYEKWHDTNGSSLFWLYGSAGTGKSMLASAVIDKLKSCSRFGDIVAFFCCSSRFDGGSLVVAILRAILWQLNSRKTDAQSHECLQALGTVLDHAADKVSISQMKYLFSTMKHNLKSYETLFLVIDGLDEAIKVQNGPDELVPELLDMMTTQDDRHRIKCFITSRPDYFPKTQLLGSVRMNINKEPSAQRDIETYVQNELSRMPKLLWTLDGYLVDGVVERIVSEARGVFLCASLQMRRLSTKAASLSISLDAVGNLLESLSKPGVFGVLNSMLDAIPTKDRSPAVQMLRWATYSARPLSLEELGYVIHCNVDLTEADVWKLSGGLLVTGQSKTVQPVHSSAVEFLDSKFNATIDWTTTFDDPHEMMARECLLALPTSYWLQILDSPLQLLDQESISGTQVPRILQYAVRYWNKHYKLAESRSKILPGLLHNCLKMAFEEEDLAFQRKLVTDPDVEISTLPSPISSLSVKIANIALLCASYFGFPNSAKLELQMGADSHTIAGWRGYTALHLAAREGHLDVAKVLLQYGADPLMESDSGDTPLAHAAYRGHYEIVELLLSAGADFHLAPSGSLVFPHSSQHLNIHRDTDESAKENSGYIWTWKCCQCGRGASSPTNLQYCPEHTCGHVRCNCYLRGGGQRSSMEEIGFEASVFNQCATCEEMRVCYSVCSNPNGLENNDAVHILGEPISKSELGLMENLNTSYPGTSSFKTSTPRRRRVKWLSGVDMNRALKGAARRGIEDVRRLLRVAGNDEGTISSITSLTQLMSKLVISSG